MSQTSANHPLDLRDPESGYTYDPSARTRAERLRDMPAEEHERGEGNWKAGWSSNKRKGLK